MAVSDENRRLGKVFQCAENEFIATVISLCHEAHLTRVVMASVINDAQALAAFDAQGIAVDQVTPVNTSIPFRLAYATPATLGIDRLAAVAGAVAEFGFRNMLIIDAGTMLTYEFFRAEGCYVGGNISLGLQSRFKAMNAFAETLPLAQASDFENVVGTSTKAALAAGALNGIVFEMQGNIRLAEQQLQTLQTIVLTGGDAEAFATRLDDQRIAIRKNLVLDGINFLRE